MKTKVKFPKNEVVEFELGKPVVILGANGSGKTRLSVKIEEINDKRYNVSSVNTSTILIHRISAQKSLTISDTISLTDYDSSWNALFCGNAQQNAKKLQHRYSFKPATFPLNDYDKVLALLFAEDYKELQEYHTANKQAIANKEEMPSVITTVREKAIEIWNALLPQRKIELMSGSIHANYDSIKYHGKEMSDGERIVLYMICQALILPSESTIIIDEPELHIHKAIMKKLWDKLEQERQDCVFIYITHDLDFATSRDTDKVLWVKSFNGTNWDYEFLDTLSFEQLPEELLYEILGTRQNILFVEGERNSYDHVLYTEFYKDKNYHIIPCGGCSEVLKIYKSKKAYEKLNNIEAYCLIDRDFRTENEINALEADGVKFLKVAEVENLFIVPALLDIMGNQLGCDTNTIQQAKDFIIELFGKIKTGQIGESFIKEINHQLTILNFKDKEATPDEIQNEIANTFSKEKIQTFFNDKQLIYNNANTVDKVLEIFNFKELSKKVGEKLDVKNYQQRVINLLQSNHNGIRKQILDALNPYMPDLP